MIRRFFGYFLGFRLRIVDATGFYVKERECLRRIRENIFVKLLHLRDKESPALGHPGERG